MSATLLTTFKEAVGDNLFARPSRPVILASGEIQDSIFSTRH